MLEIEQTTLSVRDRTETTPSVMGGQRQLLVLEIGQATPSDRGGQRQLLVLKIGQRQLLVLWEDRDNY